MSNLLVSSAENAVIQIEKMRIAHSRGLHIILVLFAAIGIVTGSIFVMRGDLQTASEPGNGAGKTRQAMSPVHGRMRAFSLAVKQQEATNQQTPIKEQLSRTVSLTANTARLEKYARLTDAITTASALTPDRAETRFYVLSPDPVRFGGKLPQAPTTASGVGMAVRDTEQNIDGYELDPPDPVAVDIADTETAAVEIERKLTALGAEHFEPPTAAVVSAPAAKADQRLKKSRASNYVSLRAGPDQSASELTVVPANAEILAEDDCKRWCRVIYKDREGYIHKSFIDDQNRKLLNAGPKTVKTAHRSADGRNLTKSRTNKHVNLRAGPDNDARVLTIVPANAEVLAQKNCGHWCRAIYKGRKGFIYNAFLVDAKHIAGGVQALAR